MNLAYDQNVSILELKPIPPHTPSPFKTQGDKVDLLSLVPATSTNGYQLYVDEYETRGEQWLRIWYRHPRGAARQVELKRHVDISNLGELLGQLQAEGDKNNPRVVFKNASIAEHADFVSYLRELGMQSSGIAARCVFNAARTTQNDATEYSNSYVKATGIGIVSIDSTPTMKGSMAVETCVRSSVLATILISAMNEVRKGKVENEKLRRAFLAKLLSGDGTLDARRTPHRLDVRVKIVDQNVDYLFDYATILAKEGFVPHVLPEHITVRAYCTWLNLLTLYHIRAFRNNRNWIKLICSIMIQIRGLENQGYKRIQELSSLESITSADVSARYDIGTRSANLWINTMLRRGLLETLPQARARGFKHYVVSPSGKKMCRILKEIERDYAEICAEQRLDDPETILQRIKRKGKSLNQSNMKTGIQPSSAE